MKIMKTKINLICLTLLFFFISCKSDNESENLCKDFDGNVYKTVQIENQVWMAENLRTKHYNNGDLIDTTPLANTNYSLENTPSYQWPVDGDENNVATYGRFYTWFVATDTRGVCPKGWHLPSQQEWIILMNYLGGYKVAGGKMKENGISHWKSPNTLADNSSGFTALPTGNHVTYGFYNTIGESCCWWSKTEWDYVNIFAPSLSFDSGEFLQSNNSRQQGIGIRCVKDK